MNHQEYDGEWVGGGKAVHCDVCGGTYREGDFPFCRGNPAGHGAMSGFDDAFEPYVDTQILDHKDPRCTGINEIGIRGVPINSRSERRAHLSAAISPPAVRTTPGRARDAATGAPCPS